MNRQILLASGMSLPPFRRNSRKRHRGTQTVVSFNPNNIASFDTFLRNPQPKDFYLNDKTQKAIPSDESRTFRRVSNEKSDKMCPTIKEETPTCLITTTAEEVVPLHRISFGKLFDSDYIGAATKRDRNLQPLPNMVWAQKWDSFKSRYGPYFYNVRDIATSETIGERLHTVIWRQGSHIKTTSPNQQGGLLQAAKKRVVSVPISQYRCHSSKLREMSPKRWKPQDHIGKTTVQGVRRGNRSERRNPVGFCRIASRRKQ